MQYGKRLSVRIGFVGQTQVGAQDIDAGLPALLPVISQARHGIANGRARKIILDFARSLAT
jgi:hypothetical protein